MTEITLLFPNQLFEYHPAIDKTRPVALIEDHLFFHQYNFHKKKIILHRASMKFYQQELCDKGITTRYFDAAAFDSLDGLLNSLVAEGIRKFHIVAPDDFLLEKRINRFIVRTGTQLKIHESPAFICSAEYVHSFFSGRKKYFLSAFYVEQRKRLNVLVDNNTPLGGKWTFDLENRRRIPESIGIPGMPVFKPNRFINEASAYVAKNFPDNYGDTDDFIFAVTREDALEGLRKFLSQRFANYGMYQDAIIDSNSFLFHSLLTPALNIGLLTPHQIIDEALDCALDNNIPINSLEGFIRQVLGWREFVRAVYVREGVKQRNGNHWGHVEKIPTCFWTGTTGLLPVDNVIGKVLKTSYSNHIERLMVMGNVMLLCSFHPDEVYRWFMELYIDAYDWVMVPNVYGMSQFADGGLMSTKPYISGSNYLLKMSNYKKGDWCELWDGLYWCFIDKHREEFLENPRMSMMVRQWDKMDKERKMKLTKARASFLSSLYEQS